VSVLITYDNLREAVPRLDGTLRLAGLTGAVEVLRDSLGIPHLRAGSAHDVFFGQGFVQAQDRLWQMEYDRRRAAGRWAAYAGPDAIEQDTLMRRLGLVASAKADVAALNGETRAMLEAYAAGVNAFIETTDRLPVEYGLVGGAPERWEPWHSCAVFKVRHALMGVLGNKLWRLRVLKTLGPDWIDRLRVGTGAESPLIVPPADTYDDVPDGMSDSRPLAELLLGLGELDGGSNNWALHGSRTGSGQPLLAGDPHRAIDVPNVYYQSHLVCPEFDAIGYAFAGLPGLPHFGHNAEVAWAVTHAMADYQDLFVERFAPGDPGRYEFRGEWRAAERRRESIELRGEAPAEIDVTVTHHGPIIIGDPARGLALTLRYTATAAPNHTFEGLLPMLRASSVDELDTSMRPWVDPGNNFVMADRAGTIGYLTRGALPLRPRANGWLPVPGWTGEYEWQGMVPFEELPRARNPDQGFIATANQRSVGPDYPHYVSLDWAPPHRAQRVNDRVKSLTSARASDMMIVHADKLSIPSRAFQQLASELQPLNLPSIEALARLLEWDGVMRPGDAASTIYAVWREQLTALILAGPTFAPLVQAVPTWELLPSQAVPLAQRLRNPIYGLLVRRDPAVLPPGESWPSLGAQALACAVEWLGQSLGPDQNGWRWDRIHRARPRHTLSVAFPDQTDLLDPPSAGIGGDGDTPQNGSYGGADATDFTVTTTSVTRYCFDLANWERSGWIVPLGSSGHPGSPHYADQLDAWAQQRLQPMIYAWERVVSDAETRQRLEPAN
jgi:penicillin amidase